MEFQACFLLASTEDFVNMYMFCWEKEKKNQNIVF